MLNEKQNTILIKFLEINNQSFSLYVFIYLVLLVTNIISNNTLETNFYISLKSLLIFVLVSGLLKIFYLGSAGSLWRAIDRYLNSLTKIPILAKPVKKISSCLTKIIKKREVYLPGIEIAARTVFYFIVFLYLVKIVVLQSGADDNFLSRTLSFFSFRLLLVVLLIINMILLVQPNRRLETAENNNFVNQRIFSWIIKAVMAVSFLSIVIKLELGAAAWLMAGVISLMIGVLGWLILEIANDN